MTSSQRPNSAARPSAGIGEERPAAIAAPAPAAEPALQEQDASTLSIRLTQAQRGLVESAAKMRGWTLTQLIRTATLEKAAHITNTSQRTKFDFKNIGGRIASILADERVVYLEDPYDQYAQYARAPLNDLKQQFGLNRYEVVAEPAPLDPNEMNQLREAVRLGGTEFLELALEMTNDQLVRRHRELLGKLPDPVDPSAN